MNVYTRYVSGDYDREHFAQTPKNTQIALRPLSGHFDVFLSENALSSKPWTEIFPQAAFFAGYDQLCFGPVVTMVYKNAKTNKISTVSLTKFGSNVYDNLILDSSLRFWPACENLKPEHQHLNVRKALAITNLKNYNKIWKNNANVPVTESWDETNAGELASTMDVLAERTPEELGKMILQLGFLQEHNILSLVVDVLCKGDDSEKDKLSLLLGEKGSSIFDPLLEYSPQSLDYHYIPDKTQPLLGVNPSIERVMKELFEFQTNYTMEMVNLLQDLIIPLRAKILAKSSVKNIHKIHTVFPPTLDEVARVNCILHDLLAKARPHGYMEVFAVLEGMIPYFYKPFVRLEASLLSFSQKLEKFVKYNGEYTLNNPAINKGSYTAKRLESIVYASLLELPRLKLIVKRLYEVVVAEKCKLLSPDETDHDPELPQITKSYNSVMNVIDSYGFKEEEPVDSSRIFTPSGKLLTEIATDWPPELQYGWMNRKVVGIHELIPVMPLNRGHVMVIIFSDLLLFIDIDIETEGLNIQLADVLMNSLVNEKRLPQISHFPRMKVKFWCALDEILVRSYLELERHYVTFMTYAENSFKDKKGEIETRSQSFQLVKDTEDEVTRIMDLVSKAKIMHKSTDFAFHKLETSILKYFCVHDLVMYSAEVSKAPLVMVVNFDEDQIHDLFEMHPLAFMALNVTFINDHTVHLTGVSRNMGFKMEEIVSVEEFGLSLKDIFTKFLNALYHSSFFSDVLISSRKTSLDYFFYDFALVPLRKLKVPYTPISSRQVSSEKSQTPPAAQISAPSRKKRFSLSHFFKKRKEVPDQASATSKITHTEIPRGKKQEYSQLYNPAPVLSSGTVKRKPIDARVFSLATQKTSATQKTLATQATEATHVTTATNRTGASSHYTNTSIEANPVFKFPLENIAEALVIDPVINKQVEVPASKHAEVVPDFLPLAGEMKILPSNVEPGPKRTLSSLEIAAALENINARGIAPETYEKYKMYENLPILLLYNDGEQNWVALARDASIQQEIAALKEEANMDTVDVVDFKDTTIESAHSVIVEPRGEMLEPRGEMVHEREPEPAEVLEEWGPEDFGKVLDKEFDLESRNSLQFSVETLVTEKDESKVANDVSNKEKIPPMRVARDLSDDSEEFFSSYEIGPALSFIAQEDWARKSVSSEQTFTMDKVVRDADKELFGVRFESVAYLLDILNGVLKI